MRPEPFFSGPGIDRADQVRVDGARLAEIASRNDGLQLLWRDGLPAVGADGRLEWKLATSSDLFLGMKDGRPHFSARINGPRRRPNARPPAPHVVSHRHSLFVRNFAG